MKNIIYIMLLMSKLFCAFSQENIELKKIKCLTNKKVDYKEVEKFDTIYIVYHKSIENEYEQNRVKLYKDSSFYFYDYIHFSIQKNNNDKLKVQNIVYKSKSFICKNINKIINVYFLKTFSRQFFERERVIFIIDLDSKKKKKYKVVQVNQPEWIVE